MSQTKQEALEYILVILDEMASETRKIIHKDRHNKFDSYLPDFDCLHDALAKIDEQIETLVEMFENTIPEEVKRIRFLEEENDALKNNLSVLRLKMLDLEKKLSFSLTLSE
jgi:hypothetical protein